jgi:hypothetical protein
MFLPALRCAEILEIIFLRLGWPHQAVPATAFYDYECGRRLVHACALFGSMSSIVWVCNFRRTTGTGVAIGFIIPICNDNPINDQHCSSHRAQAPKEGKSHV